MISPLNRQLASTLSEQIYGLRNGLLELGLARSNIRRKEIISTIIWEDTLVAIVPKGHPTLRYRRIPWMNVSIRRTHIES
ncbi:hypothetical protein [Neopusillimonas aromaticivorans]|uniref:hypothetical protein n=1 Tax=Neopusillimonas aromaticivorans TaxID=2979868 RepID=UPI002597F22F|nr:hypothetical protein [Neopusillimonas aromaticivorans]WJJ93304.1 hypothetical protein N7E01_15090 [Neopusillimonas aromaticivorans]